MDFLKKAATEAITDAVNTNNNSNNNNNNNNNNSGNNVASAVMGQLNSALSGGNNTGNNNNNDNNVASAVMGQLNNALGGGQKGEQKEDVLDKAIDLFQEKVLKAGPQDNESAIEQAKDAQIASAIRGGYKSATGKDLPV